MKAIEEIASNIDQRVFNYREVIAKEGQKDFNEMYIIYHGEAACYNLSDSGKSTPNFILTEKSLIGD